MAIVPSELQAKAKLLAGVRGRSPTLNEAIELAEAFTALVRSRGATQLDPWLQQAERSAVHHRSASPKRLRADKAVQAALSLDWSNGQTERQINRLKTIKRQSYFCTRLLTYKKVF